MSRECVVFQSAATLTHMSGLINANGFSLATYNHTPDSHSLLVDTITFNSAQIIACLENRFGVSGRKKAVFFLFVFLMQVYLVQYFHNILNNFF